MKRPGFTLIELSVSLVIMAIIILVVGTIFLKTSQFNQQQQTSVLVGDEANRIFSTLDETLREGKAILTSATVNGTLYTTGDTTLVLSVPSIVAGTPSPTVTDIIVITYDSANQLVRKISAPDASSSRVNDSGVLMTGAVGLYFRYTTDDPTESTAVTVSALTQVNGTQGAVTQPALLYVGLRNHS